MFKSPGILMRAEAGTVGFAWQAERIDAWWCRRREAALNWLALGLLLAAWNATDNDPVAHAKPRPGALRGYSYVSVRAQRSATLNHTDFTQTSRDCKG
jgi:hypothetical protein